MNKAYLTVTFAELEQALGFDRHTKIEHAEAAQNGFLLRIASPRVPPRAVREKTPHVELHRYAGQATMGFKRVKR